VGVCFHSTQDKRTLGQIFSAPPTLTLKASPKKAGKIRKCVSIQDNLNCLFRAKSKAQNKLMEVNKRKEMRTFAT